jgi:hypothetical protein
MHQFSWLYLPSLINTRLQRNLLRNQKLSLALPNFCRITTIITTKPCMDGLRKEFFNKNSLDICFMEQAIKRSCHYECSS